MRSALFMGLVGTFFGTAYVIAEPMDCDKLSSSRVPYQVTRHHTPSFPDEILQVYRSANDFVTIYSKAKDGIMKCVVRFGLAQSCEGGEAPRTFSSSTQFDGYYFDKPSTFTITEQIGTKTKTRQHQVTRVGEEFLSVGPCVFAVTHFMDVNDSGNTVDTWYSKDIKTALKTEYRFKEKLSFRPDQQFLTVTDITTEFVPFR